MKNKTRKIWERPWDYLEGFIIAAGIAVAGFALQFSLGNIIPSDFAFPINIIIGSLFTLGILFCYFFLRTKHIVRWLSSIRATIPALVVMLLLIVVMGLTPQFTAYEPDGHLPQNFLKTLGWYRMTTSWSFIFLSFYMLAILGFATLRKTEKRNTWRQIGFYLNHTGLYIAFLCGILGSADMERVTMTVNEGDIEWRVRDYFGNVKELPIAIELDTFKIEEYPPKLVIIDVQTGKMLPEGRPEIYMFEQVGETIKLTDYQIEILEYLPHAAIVNDSAFASAAPYYGEGAAPALKIRVSNERLSESVEGWISNGSYLFPYKVLYIDENTGVAMPVQEVKKYTSHIKVFTENGHSREATIEVNQPLKIDNWKIYQFSYDESKGKYSKTSIFELVYDPWLAAVYTGIFMLLAGALFMFIVGPLKKENSSKEN